MFKRIRGERGFTLVELLVVMAVMAVLIAIVIPNLTGFLGMGKSRSYEADRRTIQAAVDAYFTDEDHPNTWPSVASSAPYTITFGYLTGENLLRETPKSSGDATPAGSYTWLIDSNGIVTTTTGFVPDTYP